MIKWQSPVNREQTTRYLNVFAIRPVPVNNVRVNRTETKMYEVVECYADGFPEPTHFQWTCRSGSDITGKGWATQGHRISFVRAREYKCTCTAFNSGVAEVHSSEWSGVILVHPSGSFYELFIRNDFFKSLSDILITFKVIKRKSINTQK